MKASPYDALAPLEAAADSLIEALDAAHATPPQPAWARPGPTMRC